MIIVLMFIDFIATEQGCAIKWDQDVQGLVGKWRIKQLKD